MTIPWGRRPFGQAAQTRLMHSGLSTIGPMTSSDTIEMRRANGTASITAYIIAYNEENKIEAAISSVLWADEILLIDSGSEDATAEIAERLGSRVVQVEFNGFGNLRNSAISECRGDWIFSLDSDERCTVEARDEILSVIAQEDAADIWRVPRRNWFMGKWIKHSGWYPNFRQPQLFRRGSMTYDTLPVHEGWIPAEGARVDILKAAIWQIPFLDLSELQGKATRYSTLGSQKVLAKGGGRSMLSAVVRGCVEFTKHYVFKLGVFDGWAGFIIAFGAAEGAFYKHAKAYVSRLETLPPDAPAMSESDRNCENVADSLNEAQ